MAPRVIGIGGGKGGVGKSLVATNLAIAIAELGARTIIVDADLGTANQHTLFGIDRPGITLDAFLSKQVKTLQEVVRPTGAPGLSLVPGIGAVYGAANLPHATKLKLIRHLRRLDADCVIVDVGAGVAFNTLDLFDAGDLRLLVTTPQLTAMQNAYCFLKAAVHRSLRQRIDRSARKEVFSEASVHSETERIRDLRARVRAIDPSLDGVFDDVTQTFATRLVGNMMENPRQREVVAALGRMARDFLDVDTPVEAVLPMSRVLHDSISFRRPFVRSHPDHAASQAMRALARTLLREEIAPGRRRELAPAPTGDVDEATSLFAYLRRGARVEVRHAARVEVHDRILKARVVDLSPRGLLVEGAIGAEVGETITVQLVGFPNRPRLRGTVRHVSLSGTETGAELDETSIQQAEAVLREPSRATDTLPPEPDEESAASGQGSVPAVR
ncbi:MAG: P-loop NTPase [Myxococcales bacterium]|nr:P-loop NTPase [Myxococcales bacterium]